MGQKTNPTLLRLEKTNQHYKLNWFSDRFYPEQLHQNYKTLNYLDKVFYKIKKTLTLSYVKNCYNFNQWFCFLPKTRPRRFFFRRNPVQLDGQNVFRKKTIDNKLYLHYLLWLRKKLPLTLKKSKSKNPRVAMTKLSNVKNSLTVKSGGRDHMVPKVSKVPKVTSKRNLTFSSSPSVSRKVKPKIVLDHEIFTPSNVYSLILLYKQFNKRSNESSMESRLAVTKGNNIVRIRRILEISNYLSPIKQNLLTRGISSRDNISKTKSLDFTKGYASPLAALSPLVKAKFTDNLSIYKLLTKPHMLSKTKVIYDITKSPNLLYPLDYKNLSIYFVKVPYSEQNAQFLAQKIMWGLSRRIPFTRLRKQILWGVTRSEFVKGIRITLSGRAESRSKKAQKARDRTFQWGQTELHVLSSLVQFTQNNLVTPFGKQGIKVWVCYGA